MGGGAMRGGCLTLVAGACLAGMGVVGVREGEDGVAVALLVLLGAVLIAAGVLVGLFGFLRWLDAAAQRGRDRRRRDGR